MLLPVLAGCGVSFHEDFDGTELFKTIWLSGDRVVDSTLTVTLTVTQTYAVPLELACYYENSDKLTDDDYRVAFQERAKRIGEAVLEPYAPPLEREVLTFDFSVPEPGKYFLACMTPASPDNGLGVQFTVRASSASATQ
jgi:hypothetical protein